MSSASEPSEDADGRLSRREALGRFGLAGLALSGAGALLSACGTGTRSTTTTKPTTPRKPPSTPNVLLIIADDMRYDDLRFMPNVQKLIVDEGRNFTQARCNVPLCQPARVGLMTGQTSKYNNELGVGFGDTKLTDHDNCLGKWMSEAGYRCGLLGKYINYTDGKHGIDAPTGYDTWREFTGEVNAYAFTVHLNTGQETITGQYSSDYLAVEANQFLRGKEPFFCTVTPSQPHEPFRPRRDLADKWLDLAWPVVDEVDVSTKPSWIQALGPLTNADRTKTRNDVIGALQELSAVDDMVKQIITALDPAVLADTVVIFTSDNGVHRGEHRRAGSAEKSGPYEVALRVPLYVRGPGFAAGPDITVPSLVTQDIAATVLDIGGGKAGLPHQAGISLVELLENPGAHRQRALLHEVGEGFMGQTGDGITTGPDNSHGFRKLYRYPSLRENPNALCTYEAYDLDTDVNELSNWADEPSRRAERDALEAQLETLLDA